MFVEAMKRYAFLRTILFMLFFIVGAGSLTAVLLYPDLVQHYAKKRHYKSLQAFNVHLEKLNDEYDILTHQLQTDPNLIERLRIAILGEEPDTTDTAYPKPTAEQLAVAKQVLEKQTQNQPPQADLPKWVTRCQNPALRTTLFIAGVALVLISFTCFHAPKKHTEKSE